MISLILLKLTAVKITVGFVSNKYKNFRKYQNFPLSICRWKKRILTKVALTFKKIVDFCF